MYRTKARLCLGVGVGGGGTKEARTWNETGPGVIYIHNFNANQRAVTSRGRRFYPPHLRANFQPPAKRYSIFYNYSLVRFSHGLVRKICVANPPCGIWSCNLCIFTPCWF